MKSFEMSDYNLAARLYWWLMMTLGVAAFAWSLYASVTLWTLSNGLSLVALAGGVVLSSLHPVRIPHRQESVTAADVFVFLGAMMLGVPAAVMLAGLDSAVGSLRGSRRVTTLLAAPALASIAGLIAGKVFYLTLAAYAGGNIASYPLGTTPVPLSALTLAVVAMGFTLYIFNTGLIAGLHALKSRLPVWQFWRDNYLWTSLSFFAAALAALFVHQAIVNFGPLQVVLGVAIVAATFATYRVYFERVDEQTRHAAEMSRLHLATVEALATAIDAKDQTSHFHVRRVQLYAAEMGKLFDLKPDELEALDAGALLHDIGKLAVPDYILNKPGELTAAEFERMKIHTKVGAQILERVGFPYPVVPVVLHHHERWDGRGYPHGLRGEQIPLTARLLAVVDAFDTVREERPYRRALSRTEASSLLQRGAGSHFDPQVVETFLNNLDRFDVSVAAKNLDCYSAIEAGDVREIVETEIDNAKLEIVPDTALEILPREVPTAMTERYEDVSQASHAIARQSQIRGGDNIDSVTDNLPSASNVLGGRRVVSRMMQTPPVRSAGVVPSYLDQIRDAHREAHALYEIARTFGSSLDLQDIVSIIVNKVGNVVPFDTCAVYLYDEQSQTATVAHAAGRYADVLKSHIVTSGEGITGFVLANRHAVKGSTGHVDPMLDWRDVALPAGTRFESVMALPLVRGEQLIGALAVYSFTAEAYTEDHLRLLETVTRLASDALGNAMHHAEIESNALTDSLTGLPNSRALHVRFEEESARARRTGGSFQVVMLDLDDFKKVNDTFGHKIGDLLLREISGVLSTQMREYDFLARYAGDEFVAIVQDMDIVQINELRRRIERAVHDFSLHVRGDARARVGISIGAARFPSDGDTLDNLLVAADAAMYHQKSHHKQGRPTEAAITLDASDLASTAIN
ncbi:MAG: diguanylate cyclase [Pyrinomonadaceae bacterium MAG19_C2-C3]|nr:diguanylate cyclase [Pyrinomonadaceae bacterium MAG19_C2-C3]